MKLFKKISVIILAIIATFSFSMFVACSSPTGSGNKPPVVPPKQELITFDKTTLDMVVGDEITLPARTADSSTIIAYVYSSSNPDVASVDNSGLIIAKSKGSTTIKAQWGNFKAECAVTVTHGNLLPQISIDNVKNTLVVPKTIDYALNPYVTFNGKKFTNATFTYEQSNNNISIDQATGVITGVSIGETLVTVKASWDGVSGIATMSKTFTVKVTNTVEMYINGGSTSSITLYNKVLNKLGGEQTSKNADFNVVANDANGPLTPDITVVEGNNVVIYEEGVLKGQGVLGTAKVKVAVEVDGESFELFVDVICERAVGDYMASNGTEYKTIDFDTLTGEIDTTEIFGKSTTIVNAYDDRVQLGVEDNKIVSGIMGEAFSANPEKKVITIYDDEVGYNVEIVPYVFKNATLYANNYFFSSYDGVIFDNDMVAVDVEEVFGAGKVITEAYVETADGQKTLRISADGRSILGAEEFEDPDKIVKFAIATDDNMFYFELSPYTLIIDTMMDFDYFIIKDGTWSFKPNKYTVNAGLEWDGNYILANDIDATEYYSPNAVSPNKFQGQEKTFTYLNWLGTAYQEAHFSTTLGIKAREDQVSTIGYTGKGFSGLFDGRGHVIRNYTPTVGGLFQILNGGIVRNVGFVNATATNNAGVLCGTAFNNAIIENVFIHGNLEKGLGATYAGAYLTSGIGHTVKMHNIVIVDEFNNINYGANKAGMIDADSGSTYAQGADWTDVYFVTPLPVRFQKSGTTAVPEVEAGYVDGVKVQNDSLKILANASRFTSLEKMYEVNKANNVDLSSFNEYWELLGGYVPIFKNAITFDMLSINVGMLPATETGSMLTIGDEVEVKATYFGAPIANVTNIEVKSGSECISITDNYKIKGLTKGSASLTATYVQDGQTLSVDFVIDVVPTIEAYSEEFYYSAYDGVFFKLNADGTYSPVEDALSQIFGKATTYDDLFVAYNHEGKSLEIDKENEKILGVVAGKGDFANTYFDIYTATEGKRVNVKAATLIIDEAEDFEYFTLKHPVDYHITTNHTYTFQGNDFTWDGYYVLAKDIDATGYKHNLDNGKVYTSTSNDYNLRVFVASRVDYLAYGGGIKDRGMIGTFDGRGYVIKNLETTATGLLGYIGGTVQNVGFENCKATGNKYSFLAYGIYGSKSLLKDVYVLTTQSTVDSNANPLISTWGKDAKMQNVIIEDRTVLNDSVRTTEYNYGSLMCQAENDASTKTPLEIAKKAYSNVFILSDKALTATVPANVNGSHSGSHIVKLDAQYINGVANPEKYFAPNVRRYNSGLDMRLDTTNDYTAFNTDIWDLSSGIPVFKRRSADTLVSPVVNGSSALSVNTMIGETLEVKVLDTYQYVDADSINVTNGSATAIVDGFNVKVGATAGSFTLTITSGSHVFNVNVNVAIPEVLVDNVLLKLDEVPVAQGQSKTVTIKAYGLLVDGVVLEPATATNLVSISNNVITAGNAGVGKVDINVKFNNILLDTFTINVLANSVEFAEEYTLSALEGIFFDEDGNVADVLGQINGEILEISDAEGNELTLNAEKDKVLGINVTNAGMVTTSLYFTTADTLYKVNVKAATLVIDEAEDLEYFTLTESYVATGGPQTLFTFGENDFKWDGYYVLVKNIDATGYVHDWTGGVGAELDTISWTQSGAKLNALDIIDYYATVGNVKEYSKDPGSTEYTAKGYRGFRGVLDGQGYTISNLTTGKSGLFGIIISGIVKNIGFVNNGVVNNEGGFLAYGISKGSSLYNVYVSTNHNEVGNGYAPLVSKVSSFVWQFAKNSVIIDNAVLPATAVAEKLELGSYDSNAKRWSNDHTTYGATTGSGWIWGDNHAFVVSNKPLSGYIELNSNTVTPFIDANKVDGVKVTDSVTRLRDVLDVRRYTSVETLVSAYAVDAELYNKILATGLFEIYNGVPVFKSAIGLNTDASYNAYFGDRVVSTTVANELYRDDVVTVRIKANGIAMSEPPVSIVVNSGSNVLSVSGATITATQTGSANITIYYGSKSWTIDVIVKTPISEFEQELTLSAMEGILFDENGNEFALTGITTDTILSITDAQGNALTLTDGKVFGVKTSKTELLEDILVITTEDMIYKVSIKAATLVIDQAEDLAFFTLKSSYTTTGPANGANAILTFGEDDFKWDGYYVLVKNIDATGYVHDWTGGVAADLDVIQYAYKSEILNVTDMWNYFATLGNVKSYDDHDNNSETPFTTESYRGFMGTLDGQGYTLSNLTTGKSGLLGFIYNGQVKNIGFVNNQVANNEGGFLAYGVAGSTPVTNAFVSTTNGVAGKDFAPLITKVASNTWMMGQNSIIIDNTVLPVEPAVEKIELGSYDSNAKRWAEDHYTYGSGKGDAWQWGTTKTIIISNKPMSGYINANTNTIVPFIDAHTVDGVANTNGATLLYPGMQIYRYSSMEKAIEGYTTGNAAWTAIMNTGLFEIYNGIPVIKSALGLVAENNVNAYLGEKLVSTEVANEITKDEVVNVRIKANGILYTDPVAVITVNSGNEFVSVNGTQITAIDAGVANVTVAFGSKSWTFDIKVKVPVVEYEQELTLSAYDGLLFDANGNVVEINDITSKNIIKITDAQGNELTNENGALMGVTAGKKEMLENVISFQTAEEVIKVTVKVVTLAIDQAEDLAYFTLTESYTTTGGANGSNAILTFGEDDFKWDGYYVLVKNIDATGYVHDWTGGVAADLDAIQFSYKTEILNVTDMWGYFATLGNVKEYGDLDNDPTTPPTSRQHRGFMGVLDGQGYTLSNLVTGKSGLLGFMNEGQVMNIGFVNNQVVNNEGGFLAYGVSGGRNQVMNAYVSTTNGVAGKDFAPLITKVSSKTWEVGQNSIIIDNTVLPETPAVEKIELGSYDSNAKRWAEDHYTYGSGKGDAWKWGTTKTIIISNKPMSGYINANTTTITPFIDARTVDGVANENGATLMYSNMLMYRYSSMEKAIEGYTTGNAAWTAIMDTGLFEIYNGIPVIKSALGLVTEDNANVYFGEKVVSTEVANEITKEEAVNVRIKANGILYTDPVAVITVNSGNEFVSVNGTQITAIDAGVANVTVTFGSKSWTFDVEVVVPVVEYEHELTLSAYDGLLFDAQGNVVDTTAITSSEITKVTDAHNEELTLQDGKILGAKSTKTGFVENSLFLHTENFTYKVNVKVATLAIDQAEDLAYFTLTESYTTTGGNAAIFMFGEDDFIWDGYYVLVKNVDATGYVHDWTGGVAAELDTVLYGTQFYNAATTIGYFAQVGNMKNSAGYHKGFMGVLDGQGYTLSNLTTGRSGLLGIITSGQVKNIGFVNNQVVNNDGGFLAFASVSGRAVSNAYVSTTNGVAGKNFAPLVSKINSHTWEFAWDSIIIDNTVLPENPVAQRIDVGSYDSNAVRYTATNDHDTYGSGSGSGWTWGTTKAVVISNKPLVGYIDINSTKITPFIDAHTVDGVANETTATKLYSNLKILRYSSMEKAIEACATGNAVFTAIMATGLFEMYQGIPVFKSAIGLNTDASYNAYLGERVVSTETAIELAKDDVVNVRIKANGLLYTDPVATITVNSGAEFISVDGLTITAVAAGTANVTVAYGEKSWTFDITVSLPTSQYEQELTLSAYDGLLFDAQGNVVELTDITSKEIKKVVDAQGNELTIEDGALLGAKSGKKVIVEDLLSVYTADEIILVTVKVVTLAIDQAEDLAYFTLTESYTTTGGANGSNAILTFGEDDFKWDGYYVLVKNIDATGYVHDWTGGVAADLDVIKFPYQGEILNVTDMWGYFATLGNVKEYGDLDNDPTTPPTSRQYRGFMGVLDGQGYTLSNLVTGKSGLLGFMNEGQVMNIGFVNNQVANNEGGFLAYGVSGGRNQVMNAYVSTTNGVAGKDFAPLITKVSSKTWEVGQNSIIIDNTVLPAEQAVEKIELGSYDSNAKRWAEDHYTYGSGKGDAWKWGTTKTIIISNKPMSGYINANTNTIVPFIDARTVDGVANENGATLMYSNMLMYRYSSMEKAIEGYTTGNAAWTAIMNTGLFEIYNGIPVIKSALGLVTEDNANAYFGEKVVSTEVANEITKDEVVNVRIKANGILYTDPVAVITVNSGNEFVSVNGTQITAIDAGVANVTVTFGSKSWTFDVEVVVPVVEYEHELTLSAHDGLLFDAQGNVVDITAITSSEITKVTDAQATELTLSEGKILGVESSKTGLIENSIMLYTDNAVYKVNVKVATLAIDDKEDLSYFQIKDTYTYTGTGYAYTFGENNFKFDGYYVLVKNVDATGYVHDVTNNKCSGLKNDQLNANYGSWYAYQWNVGDFKVKGVASHGLEGVFDGQGYTLSNLTTKKAGLFGIISTGKVINTGFVKCAVENNEGGFLARMMLNNASLSNLYVYTNDEEVGNEYTPLITNVGEAALNWTNVVIIDNTKLPTEAPEKDLVFGAIASDYKRNAVTTFGHSATWNGPESFNNVTIVSDKPIIGKITAGTTDVVAIIESKTVDGVTQVADGTTIQNVMLSQSGERRYTTVEKMTGADNVARFETLNKLGTWTISDGNAVFTSAIGLISANA